MKDYSFGNHICKLRTGLGLSQFQLGALVGVTDKAVSKWENADAKPRFATCIRLADVLGVQVDELLSCANYTVSSARKELEKLKKSLWKEAYDRLAIYGTTPPPACWSRLVSEEAALKNTDAVLGFAVLEKLQEEARKRKTVIMVNGAINASFTAWLFGGTGVNPLPPHYRCPGCGQTEFVADVADGFDLPVKRCACGREYIRDGHNIPYDGYAKAEQNGTHLEIRVSQAFLPIATNVLQAFFADTTELLPVALESNYNGQTRYIHRYVIQSEHRAGPDLSKDGFWHVSAEDYWAWQKGETSFTFLVSQQLTTLDSLVAGTDVSLPDPAALLTDEGKERLYQKRCAQYPELTAPLSGEREHDFDLLVRIDGFTHGTNVWDNNGMHLVESGRASFRSIPSAREDIWNEVSLASRRNNIPDNGLALQIMESAQFGRYCHKGLPDRIKTFLSQLGLPEWYPDYLVGVVYLFPKGHCIAQLLVDATVEWGEHMRVSCGETNGA